MADWQSAPEMDETIVTTLVDAVGAETFSAMKGQFIEDLKSLLIAYEAAVAASDDKAARETAHALKGAASNIGLARLGALAACLEAGDRSDDAQLNTVFEASVERLAATA